MFLTVLADALNLQPEENFSTDAFLEKLRVLLELSYSEDFQGLEAHALDVDKLYDVLLKAVERLQRERH